MKNGYEKIKSLAKQGINLVSDEEKNVVMNYLQIKNFDVPILHTLILFDDATDVFNSPKNELNNLFLRNRHNKFTYFFNLHGFTRNNIPMKVKKNMRTLWYFGGFSKLDFNCSFLQMRSPVDRETLYEKYKTLARRDVLFFDYTDDGTKCEIFYLNEGRGRTEPLNNLTLQPIPKPQMPTQPSKPQVPQMKPSVPQTQVPQIPLFPWLKPQMPTQVPSITQLPQVQPQATPQAPKEKPAEETSIVVKPKIEELDGMYYYEFARRIGRGGTPWTPYFS
jgi:hypothetical protein